VTPEVERLRDAFGLPGMRVLAFAFADGAQAYLPHRFHRRCVVYTGTHDNDSLLGFLDAANRSENPAPWLPWPIRPFFPSRTCWVRVPKRA
jgi:4-alpha-glucanotransferase